MITLILASLCPLAVPPASLSPSDSPAVPATAPATVLQDPDPEYTKRLEEAGRDVAKLWDLAEWCKERDLRAERKSTLELIIEIEPDHEEARKALGHRQYDDQWFESYSALSKYRREEEERMREKGLVRFNDNWAPEADVPFLRMGWVKDPAGQWVHPAELERRANDSRMRSQGWQRQGLTWISPEEKEKLDEGLWKCGDQWLPLEEANVYHSRLLQWWENPGEQFITLATVGRKADGTGTLAWATWWADQCYPHLERALGLRPAEPPFVLVLNSLQQYNTFAAGDQAQGIPQSEVTGSSSVHFAYLADALFDFRVQPPLWRGMGVCYWDVADETMNLYGPFAVRHAAALSYLDAVDPSWETVSQGAANPGNMQIAAFWNEKRVPRWMHYGLASYCERFAKNPLAGEGDDPWAFRAWAIQNLRSAGPLVEPKRTEGLQGEELEAEEKAYEERVRAFFEEIFALALDSNDPAGSAKRIHLAGLLVSFMLDGECEPVVQAHQAFKTALTAGEGTSETVQALQNALIDNLDALKAYAKM